MLITLAWTTLALHGRAQALELLGEVRAFTDSPRLLALSHVQQAVVHVQCSEWREALAALDQVGAAFELLTPREQVAALINGGLSHLSLLDLEPAKVELERALALSLEHDFPEQEFKVRHNLGCLEFYAGRLPDAIRLMRSADEVDAPVARARARQDLAQVLLEAGLLEQARETLVGALGEARAQRLSLEEADIRLDLASCASLESDITRARAELDAAVRIYRARGARSRLQSTTLMRAAVDVAVGKVPRGLDRVVDPWLAAPRLVTAQERLAARVRAEASLLRGDVQGAAYAAQRLRGRAHQAASAEMHDRLLFAKIAAAQGKSRQVRYAIHTALRRLTERQAPTQSLELRSAMALHGSRLSQFDVADALASGSTRRVFDSVERWRAVSHRVAPVSSADDGATDELTTALRQTRLALGSGALPDPEVERLRRRAADLERQIAHRDWSTGERAADGPSAAAATLRPVQVTLGRRGEQALVFFTHDGRQHLVHVLADRARLHTLEATTAVTALGERLGRDLRAHAFAATNVVMAQALSRAVGASLADLDTALFGHVDLDPSLGVVVVPGRALASVPWGALPGLAGRPVTVATSMTRWLTPEVDDGHPFAVSALAGPALVRSVEEVRSVAGAWGGASRTVVSSHTADSSDLRRALDDTTVVHVAAHGTHEHQSPFFSALHLADGPVFAHELPRPVRSSHVVLSACDVGRSDLRPGDEPLGLTAALLSLGVRSVVGAVAPVSDEVAARAMGDYHRELAHGIPAAEALARTIATHPGARAFCLYGADWTPQIHRAGSRNIAS